MEKIKDLKNHEYLTVNIDEKMDDFKELMKKIRKLNIKINFKISLCLNLIKFKIFIRSIVIKFFFYSRIK